MQTSNIPSTVQALWGCCMQMAAGLQLHRQQRPPCSPGRHSHRPCIATSRQVRCSCMWLMPNLHEWVCQPDLGLGHD